MAVTAHSIIRSGFDLMRTFLVYSPGCAKDAGPYNALIAQVEEALNYVLQTPELDAERLIDLLAEVILKLNRIEFLPDKLYIREMLNKLVANISLAVVSL